MSLREIRRDIRLAVKNLTLHKLRSLLTVLGVVFGVGSVIAMLAVGEGASREALDRIRKLGSTNIILTSVKPAEDEASGQVTKFLSVYGLLYEDEQRIREALPEVRCTVPVKLIRKEGRVGTRVHEVRIVGVTPDWFRLVPRRLQAGRMLTPDDAAQLAPVCVITEHVARELLATQHMIGQHILLGMDDFEVVGIVQSEAGDTGVQMPDTDNDAYVPIDVARARFGEIILRRTTGAFEREKVELHQILVQVGSTEEVEPAAAAIGAMLRQFHRVQDYRTQVPLTLLREAEQTKRTFNIVLGAIAGISLLVGGIGIMNIMLASVTERTREIGIRRAIGAKQRQIIRQFLIETVVLATLGGLIGIGVGLVIPWLITRFSGMTTLVTPLSIILALGISAAIGILFGLYPAIRAARLDPIEALRHE